MRHTMLVIVSTLIIQTVCSQAEAMKPSGPASRSRISAEAVKSRTLEFNYEIVLGEIPKNASEIKVWLPHIAETPYQTIEDVVIESPQPPVITRDKIYNNKIITVFLNGTLNDPPFRISARYKVRRYEFTNKPGTEGFRVKETKENLRKYLKPNRLGSLSPEIKALAAKITAGKNATIKKARVIYDYVFDTVSYDKSIPGWGRGDTARVCLLNAGNCTDFHSFFISLVQAQGIPAKFVIGVPIPKGSDKKIPPFGHSQ